MTELEEDYSYPLQELEEDYSYPLELLDGLIDFSDSLDAVEDVFKPFLQMTLEDMEKLDPLDQAKLHLTAAYAINSLFWIYLRVQGIDPDDYPIKHELDRIRSYMNRAKEVEEGRKAAQEDQAGASRVVKTALLEPSKQPADTAHLSIAQHPKAAIMARNPEKKKEEQNRRTRRKRTTKQKNKKKKKNKTEIKGEQEQPGRNKKDREGTYEVLATWVNPIACPLATRKLTKRLYKTVRKASKEKNIRKGIRNVQKYIKRGERGIVLLAGDTTPIDVYCHLPVLCEDAKLPYCYVPARQDLGEAAGSKHPTCCVLLKPSEDYQTSYDKCLSDIATLPRPT